MGRVLLSVVAGLVAWGVVATVLNFGVRLAIPGYVEAEPVLAFTLAMQVARLSLAAVASLGAGAVARMIAPDSRAAPWVIGAILLCVFVPVHVQIGDKLPLWYHLTFLLTLAPLVALGAKLVGSRTRGKSVS